MTTFRLICLNPETGRSTIPELDIATRDEAEDLKRDYEKREKPRNGVLLEFRIEEEE